MCVRAYAPFKPFDFHDLNIFITAGLSLILPVHVGSSSSICQNIRLLFLASPPVVVYYIGSVLLSSFCRLIYKVRKCFNCGFWNNFLVKFILKWLYICYILKKDKLIMKVKQNNLIAYEMTEST